MSLLALLEALDLRGDNILYYGPHDLITTSGRRYYRTNQSFDIHSSRAWAEDHFYHQQFIYAQGTWS